MNTEIAADVAAIVPAQHFEWSEAFWPSATLNAMPEGSSSGGDGSGGDGGDGGSGDGDGGDGGDGGGA